MTLTLLLRDEGYETQAAYSAEGLWAAIKRFDPQAILLDIGLPDRNGYDLARELRQRFGERIVLIAVTAWTKASDQMLAQMAGFDHHLGKPYDPRALLALLKPLSEGSAADT